MERKDSTLVPPDLDPQQRKSRRGQMRDKHEGIAWDLWQYVRGLQLYSAKKDV